MKTAPRLFILVILLIIGYLLIFIAGSRAEYANIVQLREEVKDGWHETYQAYGRTISVNTPVFVPAVESLPVLRIKKQPAVDSGLLKEYADVINDDNQLYFSQVPQNKTLAKEGDAWFKTTFTLLPEEIDWSRQLTGDNPLTAGEAISVFDQLFSRLYGHSWQSDFVMDSLWVTSRLYAYNRKTKEFGEPMNASGSYYFSFTQKLCGIPVLVGGSSALSPNLQECHPCPAASASARISKLDDYSIGVEMVQILDISCPDVPLLSFAAVKAEYEKWIESGHLREVKSLSLGYGFSADPDRKGVYWAYPVWVLEGVLYRNAAEEPMPPPEEGYDTRPTRRMVLPAQKGPVMPQFDEELQGWQIPGLIRWEDVQ